MTEKTASSRLKIALALAAAVFLVLALRLAYLQLYKGIYYGAQADGNRMRSTMVLPARGRIVDIKGRVLADSTPGYAAALQPGKKLTDPEIKLLAKILAMTEEDIRKKISKNPEGFEFTVIKPEITPQEMAALEENYQDLPGVEIQLQPMRVYNYKEMAAHVLGYTGEISEEQIASGRFKGLPQGSIVGKDGIELTFDEDLRGRPGRRTEEVDVRGRPVRELAVQPPKSGSTLVLTIDLELQQVLEEALDTQLKYLHGTMAPNANAAAAIAMDPKTGAVRALVSRPAYDPNWFVNGISTAHWKVISDNPNYPLTDRAISGEYPAGSTFKVVTGSAALDLEKVTPGEMFYDSGKHPMADMGNAGGEALGWINFQTAMAMSDNVYFYEMGRRVGIEELDRYADKFGFGKKTGIPLAGEATGLVPGPESKKKVFDDPWTLGDTFNAAIGQGITLVTPVQIAQMLSTIAADGVRHPPYLVEKVIDTDSRETVPERPKAVNLGLKEDTVRTIQRGLEGVTRPGGTAAGFSSLPRAVAGKTGTAENPHGRDHGWFIAYAPADDPQICVACVVEQGGFGSTAAGPVVYRFLQYFLGSSKPATAS